MIDAAQLLELEPHIESAHAKHAARSKSPFDPLLELYNVSGFDGSFIETIQGIHAEAADHFRRLDHLEIDYRPVLASSFLVNLLTEDNLPHYTKTIDRAANTSEAFSAWLNRWTNEEHQHGVILRDYAIFSGIIGLDSAVIPHSTYHEGVISQLEHGTQITISSLASGFAYLSFQEGLTLVAHRNEDALLDSTGRRIVKRVAADEAGHENFYSYLQSVMLDLYPDEALIATAQVRRRFAMPGALGIPQFTEHAARISQAGLFTPDMMRQVQNKHIQGTEWNIAHLQPKSEDGKKAQESLLGDNDLLIRLQKKNDALQDTAIADALTQGKLIPFILGKTVAIDPKSKQLVRLAF